jgi:hypothetical protein
MLVESDTTLGPNGFRVTLVTGTVINFYRDFINYHGFLKIFSSITDYNQVQGLCGDDNDICEDDLMIRGNGLSTEPNAGVCPAYQWLRPYFNDFGLSWIANDFENLFMCHFAMGSFCPDKFFYCACNLNGEGKNEEASAKKEDDELPRPPEKDTDKDDITTRNEEASSTADDELQRPSEKDTDKDGNQSLTMAYFGTLAETIAHQRRCISKDITDDIYNRYNTSNCKTVIHRSERSVPISGPRHRRTPVDSAICDQMINGDAVITKCLEYGVLTKEEVKRTIEDCKADIELGGSGQFTPGHVYSLQQTCAEKLSLDAAYRELIRDIEGKICPGACNLRGQCVKGQCQCDNPKDRTAGCSIPPPDYYYSELPPVIQ